MKIGLKVGSNEFFNMSLILTWRVLGEGVYLDFAIPDYPTMFICSDRHDLKKTANHVLEVNEVKRIIREVSEYMGVKSE